MEIKLLLLIALCNYITVNAQREEEPDEDVEDRAAIPCDTNDNKLGFCIKAKKCRQMMSGRMKNPKLCFYRRNIPFVCCPNRRLRPPTRRPAQSPPRPSPGRPEVASNSGRSKVSLNVLGCGKRINVPANGTSFVVGGKEAYNYSWPWMAAIRVKLFDDYTAFLCGGSLITSRHVLSAAHCFANQLASGFRQPTDFKIVLGSHYRASDTPNNDPEEQGITIARVVDIKLHDDFDGDSKDNDIAILTLDRDVPMTDRVRPVCLPSIRNPERSNYVTVIGWGDTTYGGVGSKTLQEATFNVIEFQRCRRLLRKIPSMTVTENMLCAGDLSGKKDSCQNDSGGPLMAKNVQENKYTQVGIVSFGYRCAEKYTPALYTKVINLVPWIEYQIRS